MCSLCKDPALPVPHHLDSFWGPTGEGQVAPFNSLSQLHHSEPSACKAEALHFPWPDAAFWGWVAPLGWGTACCTLQHASKQPHAQSVS
jgi:hypothetical protein